ncbi:MAG: protein-tyrosine phosphatase [Paraglaciecola sp.]|jgi:protein-tyrosine phosphatase
MTEQLSSVLFVCLGNICRSPTAEAVFKCKAEESGLNIHVDSAGTHAYHNRANPDQRSQAVGELRGYNFQGLKCRKVVATDFEEFDYIIAMDQENQQNLVNICPAALQYKISLLMSHSPLEEQAVPDPYYGGMRGFEYVLDLIESGADGLLVTIKSRFG